MNATSLLVEVDLLAHAHPAFFPGLLIITFENAFCYHFFRQIFAQAKTQVELTARGPGKPAVLGQTRLCMLLLPV